MTANLTQLNQQYTSGITPSSPPTEGAGWFVECKTGFRWDDGAAMKIINCSSSKVWKLAEACLGMNLLIHLTIFRFISILKLSIGDKSNTSYRKNLDRFYMQSEIHSRFSLYWISQVLPPSFWSVDLLMCPCSSQKRYFHAALNCGDPSTNLSVANQQFSSGSSPSSLAYQTSASVNCLIGFKWTDGSLERTISCLATSSWSSLIDCFGIFRICIFKTNVEINHNSIHFNSPSEIFLTRFR